MATSPPLVRLLTKEQTGRALLAELEMNHPLSIQLIEKLKLPSECQPGEDWEGPTMADIFNQLTQDQQVKDAFIPLKENLPASTLAERGWTKISFNGQQPAMGDSSVNLRGLDITGVDPNGQTMTASAALDLTVTSDRFAIALFGYEPGHVKIKTEGTYVLDVSILAMGRCSEKTSSTAPTFDEVNAYDYRLFLQVLRPSVNPTTPFYSAEIIKGTITKTNLQNAAANVGAPPSNEYIKTFSNTLHFLENDQISLVLQRGPQLASYGGSLTDALVLAAKTDSMSGQPNLDLHNHLHITRME